MGGPGENGQTPPDDEDQGTVYVQGSGDVTVTVESYSTDVNTSGAAAADLRSVQKRAVVRWSTAALFVLLLAMQYSGGVK